MFKGSTPSDTDVGAGIIAQLLGNDIINKLVDDTAILSAGLAKGNVVKWNSANTRWELCNGTIPLASSDVIGIVEYVNGTSGQVRIAGVYTDTNGTLAANTQYYCQDNGILGSVVTKVSLGRTTSAGRLLMPSSGGAVSPATTTSIGGVIVGDGLAVDTTGKISALHGKQLFTANGTFIVPAGVTTLWVECKGGGGGGGGGCSNPGATSSYGGRGGTGQLTTLTPINVTPGQSINITIGDGGAGSSYPFTNDVRTAGNGGTTSFGTYLSAVGGTGATSAYYLSNGDGGQNGSDGSTPSYTGGAGLGYTLGLSFGAGGTGTSGANYGQTGHPGCVYIEW